MIRNCKICKKVLKNSNEFFCSQKCRAISRLVTKIEKTCLECRKKFLVYPSSIKRQYCSSTCRKLARADLGGKIKLTCFCGKDFTVRRAYFNNAKKKNGNLYCSIACSLKARKWADSPNYGERKLAKILKPFGFRFVGDGSLFLGRRCPDFVHKSKKLIVELFGARWHYPDQIQERKSYFLFYGYRCLVLWYSALSDPSTIKSLITSFTK